MENTLSLVPLLLNTIKLVSRPWSRQYFKETEHPLWQILVLEIHSIES